MARKFLVAAVGVVAAFALLNTIALPFSTVVGIGFVLGVVGVLLRNGTAARWDAVGSTLLVAGTFACAGGLVRIADSGAVGFLLAAGFLLAGAVLSDSRMMAGMSVVCIAGSFGAITSYEHQGWTLTFGQPALTVVLFGILAAVAYRVAADDDQSKHLAVAFARASVLMVNFGFWDGSLWGDHFRTAMYRAHLYTHSESAPVLPAGFFSLAWAACIGWVAIWGAKQRNRRVFNSAAVFGAIHFYTQCFKRFGCSDGVLWADGVVTGLILALIYACNRHWARAGKGGSRTLRAPAGAYATASEDGESNPARRGDCGR